MLKKANLIGRNLQAEGVISYTTSFGLNKDIVILVTIRIDTTSSGSFMMLEHQQQGYLFRNLIQLEAFPTNIGNSYRYYFKCPGTNSRCSKLYLYNNSFISHNAIANAYYEYQITAKKFRAVNKLGKQFSRNLALLHSTRSKYFKKSYAGELTKRQKKVVNSFMKLGN